MLATRIIARLDVKTPLGVVKGRRMDGLRVVGDPLSLALQAEVDEADELLVMDVVASLYGRGPDVNLVAALSNWLTTPLTVGGGIQSVGEVRALLRAGADRVAVNSAALARPALLGEIARAFGSQAVAVAIDAKRTPAGWTAYTLGGREPSGRAVVTWAAESVDAGAGEILLTSVDHDGMNDGGDLPLIRAVATACPHTPIVASGGFATTEHVVAALDAGADAVAVASLLHAQGLARLKADLATQGRVIRWG